MERETVYLRNGTVITLPKLSFTNAKRLGKSTTFSTFSHVLKTDLGQFHHWYNTGYTQFKCAPTMRKFLIRIVTIITHNFFPVYKGLSYTLFQYKPHQGSYEGMSVIFLYNHKGLKLMNSNKTKNSNF